ncbi:hypothetical protein MMYC01_203024 [Madurella mycetomatis]|uniref:Uncharacterized protein n=1 Tax=Madurella mycetomatis TaxID=100816 RepID=A0A175W7K0_9PEZI|nr:hypothetical protein MMYC01_203024 [Madurella mycetomatis]
MGTRHLICIFWKGKWVLAQYGQYDGYPEGQGVKIFHFLSVACNIDLLKVGLEHIYEPTEEELAAIDAECQAWNNERDAQTLLRRPNMFGINQLYPGLARETSAGILGLIARAGRTATEDGMAGDAKSSTENKPKKIPVRLDLEFANDTWYCEWAYVVDLDKEVMEVYGEAERKHETHRFVDVGPKEASVPCFVCSLDFRELYLMMDDGEFLAKVQEGIARNREREEADENRTSPPERREA